jgi:hypothetical protein
MRDICRVACGARVSGEEHEAEHIDLRRKFRSMTPWQMLCAFLRLIFGCLMIGLGARILQRHLTGTTRRALIDALYMVELDYDVADEGAHEARDIAERSLWHP